MIRLLFAIVALSTTLQSQDPTQELLKIRRIYIDKFGGGDTSSQVRDMLIASIMQTKLFLLTEDPDKADAMLKGSAEDLVFTETFQSSDSIDGRVSLGSSGTSRSTSRLGRGMSAGVGQNESSRIAERKHEASASVRLVNKAGDVIWSTTQESQGGKFKGASADVADLIAKQLTEDYQKAKRPAAPPSALMR